MDAVDARYMKVFETATIEDLERGLENALSAMEFGHGIYRPNRAQREQTESLRKHIVLLRAEIERRKGEK